MIFRKFTSKNLLSLIIALYFVTFLGVLWMYSKIIEPNLFPLLSNVQGSRPAGNINKALSTPIAAELQENRTRCNQTIKYLSSHVTQINDVILHPELIVGTRKGGEATDDVNGQSEMEEYFRFKYGFLNVSCFGNFSLKTYFANIQKRHHIYDSSTSEIINAISISEYTYVVTSHEKSILGLTVGICRKDHANLYWILIELYSAYMSAREIDRSSRETTILIMDAHPKSHLDVLWNITFKKVMRVGWLNEPTHFEDFALVPSLKLVPFVTKSLPIPYIDDFRYDVSYEAGGFPSRRINCKRLKMTLVLGKNYVAHPRNKDGKIERQVKNADEIVKALHDTYPTDVIREVAFETLSVREQVKLSTDTDILLGVHGVGLAHTFFQIPGAGFIELFPYEYGKSRNSYFEQLAKWSDKEYASWSSDKQSAALHVPSHILTGIIESMRKKLCNTIE